MSNIFTLQELKKLNPMFNFNGWQVVNPENNFLMHGSKCINNYLRLRSNHTCKIWLDKNGYIIIQSLQLARSQIQAMNTKQQLKDEIKTMMCKPIIKQYDYIESLTYWTSIKKVIKQKEKGINRLKRKINKIILANGGIISHANKFNKIQELKLKEDIRIK